MLFVGLLCEQTFIMGTDESVNGPLRNVKRTFRKRQNESLSFIVTSQRYTRTIKTTKLKSE